MRKSIAALAALFTFAMVAPAPVAVADTLSVPKTTWSMCSALRVNYCIQTISIQPLGNSAPVDLTYVPSGTALTPAPAPAPVATDTATATADTKTATDTTTAAAPVAPAAPVVPKLPAGAAIGGMFSHADWASLGLAYDGLFVDVKTANSFTNAISINVSPAVVDAANKAYKATKEGSKYPGDLSTDVRILVKINVGNFKTGVTIANGQNVTIDATNDDKSSTFVVSGEPSSVAMAADSKKDCVGETGKSLYEAVGLQVYIFPYNDSIAGGFGVDGVSGDMYVATNGLCGASTPVWNGTELVWTTSAPHFASDGTTVNRGYYNAVIPAADAKILWGLENANDAATALEVSVTDDGGGPITAATKISVKSGKIYIDWTGFKFSSPKIHIKKNPKYVPSKATASVPANATNPASVKKTTITCAKGKTTKKVTAVSPKCPAGWTKKK